MIFEPISDEYLPNENLEYGNPHSNALLTFSFKETMNMLSVACTCSRYQLHKSFLVHQIRISEIYPGIEIFLPILSYPGCHVGTTYIGCAGTHAYGRQVTLLLS